MPTIQKITKAGNSLHIVIPQDVIRHFERKYGELPNEVQVNVNDRFDMHVKVLKPIKSERK